MAHAKVVGILAYKVPASMRQETLSLTSAIRSEQHTPPLTQSSSLALQLHHTSASYYCAHCYLISPLRNIDSTPPIMNSMLEAFKIKPFDLEPVLAGWTDGPVFKGSPKKDMPVEEWLEKIKAGCVQRNIPEEYWYKVGQHFMGPKAKARCVQPHILLCPRSS